MADLDVRVAVLEADSRSHALSDNERYGRIENTLTQIAAMIADIARKLDDGLKRSHDMREADISKIRHDATVISDRIGDLQTKVLASGAALLLAIVVFFVAPFFVK